MKKKYRYAKIRDIIQKEVIETQEELAAALADEGVSVTQATISRDIKELMLIKIPTTVVTVMQFPPSSRHYLQKIGLSAYFKELLPVFSTAVIWS